jgi:hypothetical protein
MPGALTRERYLRERMRRTWPDRGGAIALALLLAVSLGATRAWAAAPKEGREEKAPKISEDLSTPTHRPEEASLKEAAVALPVAAALGRCSPFAPSDFELRTASQDGMTY